MTQKKIALVVLTAVGGLVLTGCGEDPKASGLLDEVKYVKSVKAVPAKTHVETQPKTKRVCIAKNKKGVCTSYADRPDGTARVAVTDKPAKPGKSALYCVELDNVNGDRDDDDQWFAVSWETYSSWEGKNEGTKVTDMKYSRKLSACKH